MSTPVLDQKACLDILVSCVTVGQSRGNYSIKDASTLYRIVNYLKGSEDAELTEKGSYDALLRAVVISNGKGSYSLQEAALIEKVVDFLSKAGVITKQESPSEPQKQELSSIKEI